MDAPPLHPAFPPAGPERSGAAPRPASSGEAARTRPAAPAFEALLERLEEQSRSLAARTRDVDGPGELPAAVDEARATLESALSIGDRLLEAYRATVQRGDAGGAE